MKSFLVLLALSLASLTASAEATVTPQAGAILRSGPVVLSWSATGFTHPVFWIEVEEADGSASRRVYFKSTETFSVMLEGCLLNHRAYVWSVDATEGGKGGSTTVVASRGFTVSYPDEPSPTPSISFSADHPSLAMLTWPDVSGSKGYVAEVDTRDDFEGIPLMNGSTLLEPHAVTSAPLVPGVDYYARTNHMNSAGIWCTPSPAVRFQSTFRSDCWSKTFYDPTSSQIMIAPALYPRSEPGYLIVGGYGEANVLKTAIERMSPTGQLQSSMLLSTGYDGRDIVSAITPDDRILLGGVTVLDASFRATGVWLAPLNDDGTVHSPVAYRCPGQFEVAAIAPTKDGGAFITGTLSQPTLRTSSGFLIRTDRAGEILWQRLVSCKLFNSFNAVIPTVDLGCIVLGTIHTPENTDGMFWAARFSEAGDVLWLKTYSFGASAKSATFEAAAMLSDGSIILAGSSNESLRGNKPAMLVDIDGDGRVSWQETIGGTFPAAFSIRGLAAFADGGFLIAGNLEYSETESFGSPTANNGVRRSHNDAWVARCGVGGELLWSRAIGERGMNQCAVSTAVDSSGRILVAGASDVYSGRTTPGGALWLFQLDGDHFCPPFGREVKLLAGHPPVTASVPDVTVTPASFERYKGAFSLSAEKILFREYQQTP